MDEGGLSRILEISVKRQSVIDIFLVYARKPLQMSKLYR